MQPAARLQAVIEILEDIETGIAQSGVPADVAVSNYTRTRRYIGSKDRRAITEMAYTIIRQRGRHAWRLAQVRLPLTGRNLVISHVGLNEMHCLESFGATSPHAPAPLTATEQAALDAMPASLEGAPVFATLEVPDELVKPLQERFASQFEPAVLALNEQAALDLRSNPLKTDLDLTNDLIKIDQDIEKTKYSPIGCRSKKRLNVSAHPLLREGKIEVQDEAAQVASYLAEVDAGMSVLDLCAGAGGKSLLMSALMQNKGQVFAFDTSGARLKNAKPRLDRAGCRNVQTKQLPPDEKSRSKLLSGFSGKLDRVVVDAPCSGTGTWRRNPDQRWRLGKAVIDSYAELQAGLLAEGAGLVKPGGRLVYMTCSLLKQENEQVIARFLDENSSDYSLLDYKEVWQRVLPSNPADTVSTNPFCMQFVPHLHQTDGFFVAILERRLS